jgi:catechol-2,3-dioxygenase
MCGKYSRVRLAHQIFFVYWSLTKRRRICLGFEIFEKFRVKSSFHCLLKYHRHLGFFSKNFDGIELKTQKSIRIDHLMLQIQRGTTKRFFLHNNTDYKENLDFFLKKGQKIYFSPSGFKLES